ncbi:TonB-dependent receptor [Capnocytophaga sp.]|uniref:TonB-dependent receptor n=1 Tax=Capnocytophaga sp. TaxID=44737 RepID=UPI0026DDAC5C|nr:TonB-dependent receptor [Capnocytophaga sp.]MDO5104384.1 carboxypeptidase-like regulatory domain-containing protein [Capnocytophaga sp.]
MKNWVLNLALILLTSMTYAQGVVTGTIIDGELNVPLPGASVVVKGTSKGVSTDMDGKFSLQVSSNTGILEVSYVGFVTQKLNYTLSAGKASVRVVLQPDAQALDEVIVTGSALLDIAQERKTPVAVSTIKASEIVERLGTKEFPEILNRTPSVYATKGGGGFGDSKINIRGFANENIAVMVNGMPVNDMENGKVYWSNWAGISDVTSAMQVQRGLGASKLAIASVGGTINVVTRASEMAQGGTIYAGYGNNGGNHEYKGLVSYNTGKSQSGWSSSVLFSRSSGQKYADGTRFEGYNYYFALGYAPSEKHSLQFMITGAPQWHDQRSSSVSIADAIKYGGTMDKPNRRYNSDWGYLNGEAYSNRRNAYHKPVMMLNWDWNITEQSALSTVVYASLGRGFGTGDTGSAWSGEFNQDRKTGKYSPRTVRLTSIRNSDGLIDFDAVEKYNKGEDIRPDYKIEQKAEAGNVNSRRTVTDPDNKQHSVSEGFARRASVNSHDWYGFLTNFNHKIDKNFTVNIGLDGRYYYGYHYQVLTDLWGASSYRDTSNKNLSAPNNVSAVMSDKPNYNPFGGKIAPIEERITYSNDGEVRWMGLFAQLEYSDDNFSAFVQGSSSLQGFQRIDEFLKPGTEAVKGNPATVMERKTGFKDILGYNIKGGVNYNINEQHNVFANVGYYSKQPFLNAVYPNNRNFSNPNLTNEKIFGMEAGYGFKSSIANVNLNVYRTSWKDRFVRKSNDVTNAAGQTIRAYANVLGVVEIHQGVELEANVTVTDYLKFRGSYSLGDWFYEGNAEGSLFNESNELIDNQGNVVTSGGAESITLFLDKVKVGDSAQQTVSLGATVTPLEGLNINADWRYVSNLYANLNVTDFTTQAAADKGALRLPNYNLFDLNVSYKLRFKEKQALTISAGVDNLLDTHYIAESYDNKHAKTLADFKDDAAKGTAQQQFDTYQSNNLYKGVDTSNRVYFGAGRTWNVGLRYTF